MRCLWVLGFVGLLLPIAHGLEVFNGTATDVSLFYSRHRGFVNPNALMVEQTLITSAASKGAVCLDGSLPAYHLHRGYGAGANNWVIHLEGGGWCNNRRTCVFRKTTEHGSSDHMDKTIPFEGILSNKANENPDFHNWNRVKVRYCDGGSFSGEGYHDEGNLFFRGQRIWSAAIDELMSKGLKNAKQALLSGCSAGGLSAILHCDEFRDFFPHSTRVKCLADAGFFLDVVDIAGDRALRTFFEGVVTLQGAAKNLPKSCTSKMDPNLCMFPQYIVSNIKTPLFLLNSAYDLWQVYEAVAPNKADPTGAWMQCKKNLATCTSSQISTFQGFRNEMLHAVRSFSQSSKNGLFLNSCFAHCQSEISNDWFSKNSPQMNRMKIAQAFGDWFFERSAIKVIDCPYPCDKSCHHLN